jgi:hypothetical protein
MAYTEEQASHLVSEQGTVASLLKELMLQTVVQGQESSHTGVREHLLHGVARRINVLGRAIENIFGKFPPSTSSLLERDALYDVQINLHAFVMNLYGVFDNWAWAFVFRHGLESEIRDRRGVGLFHERTTRYLPPILRDYLSSSTTTDWHEKYLKSFRDALAHRIPLYIPPAEITPEEGDRYNRLESEKVELIRTMQWDRLEEVWDQQAELGRPSFVFLHAFSEDDPPRPILLHPQLLCDAGAIVEFGTIFLKHWHERA